MADMCNAGETCMSAWHNEAARKQHSHKHFAFPHDLPQSESEALKCVWYYNKSYERYDLCGSHVYHPAYNFTLPPRAKNT